MNKRQWAYRVRHALCWRCCRTLVQVPNTWLRCCPLCKTAYPELVRLQWLAFIERGRVFGYPLGEGP